MSTYHPGIWVRQQHTWQQIHEFCVNTIANNHLHILACYCFKVQRCCPSARLFILHSCQWLLLHFACCYNCHLKNEEDSDKEFFCCDAQERKPAFCWHHQWISDICCLYGDIDLSPPKMPFALSVCDSPLVPLKAQQSSMLPTPQAKREKKQSPPASSCLQFDAHVILKQSCFCTGLTWDSRHPHAHAVVCW